MRTLTRHLPFSSVPSAAPRRSLRVHASSSATSAKQEQPAWTGERNALQVCIGCDTPHFKQCDGVNAAASLLELHRQHPSICHSLNISQPASGESLLSSLVNLLIATQPLYAIMKIFAKNAMKTSAAKKGVAWDEHVQQLQADPEVQNAQAIVYACPDSLQFVRGCTPPCYCIHMASHISSNIIM